MTKLQMINKIQKGVTVQDVGVGNLLEHFYAEVSDNKNYCDFRMYVDSNENYFIEFYGEVTEVYEDETNYGLVNLNQEFRFYSNDEQFDDVTEFFSAVNKVDISFEKIDTVTYQFLKENELETLNGLCYEDEESIFIQMECLLPCEFETSVEWVDTQECLYYLLQKEFNQNYNYSVVGKLNEVLGDLMYNVRTDNVLEEINKKEVVKKILDKIIDIRIYEKFLVNGYTIPIKALIEIEEKLTKEIENYLEDFVYGGSYLYIIYEVFKSILENL